jgi:integrase
LIGLLSMDVSSSQADAEFGLFLRLLCYTGMRLGEALSITLAQVDLQGQKIYLSKNQEQ